MIVTNKTRPILLLAALGVTGAAVLAFSIGTESPSGAPLEAAQPREVSAALIVLGYLRGAASKTWTTELLQALLYYATDRGDLAIPAAVSPELSKQVADRAPALDARAIIAAARVRDDRAYQAALLTAV